MKKKANEFKKSDKIIIGGKEAVVDEIEVSDLGKHGKKKVRIVALTSNNEKIVVVRPEDYPLDSP
jgi:translation elongation factor P/translation initiation factor 5A